MPQNDTDELEAISMSHHFSPRRALVAASAATALLAALVLPGVPAAGAHAAHAPVKTVPATKAPTGSSTI